MEGVNLCAAVLTCILAVVLAGSILESGTVSAMSDLLYADALSSLVVLLVAFVYLACAVYAVGYFRDDETSEVFEEDVLGTVTIGKLREYYALTPLFVSSMLLVALSNNLGIMWVAIEGTTLASVFLVTFYGRTRSSAVLACRWRCLARS
jgi:hydrogenase-4 component F